MGFEVVVRPAVFPNIRPQRPGLSLPGDAPDKGFASISGSSGGLIDLPWSELVSISKGHREKKRTYYKVRVPTTQRDGMLDWGHYHEYEVMERVDFEPSFEMNFTPPKEQDNMRLMGKFSRSS